jgi:hypothetical protein
MTSLEDAVARLARDGEIDKIRLTARGYQVRWCCYQNGKWYDTIENPRITLAEALQDIVDQSRRDGIESNIAIYDPDWDLPPLKMDRILEGGAW